MDETTEREALIDAAEAIHAALSELNLHGDSVDGRIATQAPGLPYGDIHSGLRSLCEILWPGLGEQILADTHHCGTTLRESASFFTLRSTRLAGLSSRASDDG